MKKIKLKKKKNRWFPFKIFFIICLFSFSFCFTLRYFASTIDNELFLKILLDNGSSHLNIQKDYHFFNRLIGYIMNIDFHTPTTLLKNNYVGENFITSADDDKAMDLIPTSNYIKDPYEKMVVNNPVVYLYNTHQSEEYSSANLASYNVVPTVMMTSYILREKLNKNDIPTIVEENDVTEFLKTNNWNYASSYQVTRYLMEDAYRKNPSLQYFIDIHRDSVNKTISTTVINGKKYAKILFIVGLENKTYQDNLKLTQILNNSFQEKYPTLSRGIYKKKGPGVNGVYNQDFNSNTILIEVGGELNTIDEVYNTCEAISTVLTNYIRSVKYEE